MGTPSLKIYTANDDYIASVRYLLDAAMLVGHQEHGATVRAGHLKRDTLWKEGSESILASDSFDEAVEVMSRRWNALRSSRA